MPLLPLRQAVPEHHDDEHPAEEPSSGQLHISEPQTRETRTLARNRRKHYLEKHPGYFSSKLESADPLLYDRLVRYWQSNAEREAERKDKGFSGMLEADMMRSEARVAALASGVDMVARRGADGELRAEEREDALGDAGDRTKEGDWARWKWEMEARFMAGEDGDFDYAAVDGNESYDDVATQTRDCEEAYFGEQEPQWEMTDGRAPEGETGIQDF